jgi:hypothetical protein
VRGQKGVHLVCKYALLDGGEELFCLRERQAQVLNALGVLLPGDDVGHSFFTAIIGAQDELQFDAHGEAPPVGVVSRWVSSAILWK